MKEDNQVITALVVATTILIIISVNCSIFYFAEKSSKEYYKNGYNHYKNNSGQLFERNIKLRSRVENLLNTECYEEKYSYAISYINSKNTDVEAYSHIETDLKENEI